SSPPRSVDGCAGDLLFRPTRRSSLAPEERGRLRRRPFLPPNQELVPRTRGAWTAAPAIFRSVEPGARSSPPGSVDGCAGDFPFRRTKGSFLVRSDGGQHSTMLTARPPREVSLYLT